MSKLLAAYKTVRDMHAACYAICADVKQLVPTHGTPKTVADGVLVTRKIRELLDSTEKEFRQLQAVLANTGGMLLIAKGDGEPLRGRYCSAHGKQSTSCEVPSRSKNPEKYARLCELFGVQNHDLTRLHYPALKQAISERLAVGQNLPPELESYKQYSEFTLVAAEITGSQLEQDATEASYVFSL